MRIRPFECSLWWKPEGYDKPIPYECEGAPLTTTIFAETRSKARYRWWLHLREFYNVGFQDIRVRATDSITMSQMAAFAETAKRRGLSFARIGMRVECDGRPGVIVGKNDSANFQIHFTDGPRQGQEINCHPSWRMKYFGKDGTLIHDSDAASGERVTA